MPRRLRHDFPGAWHHVMNRGAGRRPVYDNDEERERFLGCVSVATDKYEVEVHSYCLLGNHYHLLVRSKAGQLSEAMRWIAGRYTQSLNYDKGKDGPLFRGRYASVLIGDDSHLTQALRYIHLNPFAAGLVGVAESWQWSSAAAYAGSVRPQKWLFVDPLLEMFGPDQSRSKYMDFMRDGAELAKLQQYELFLYEHGVRPAGSDP